MLNKVMHKTRLTQNMKVKHTSNAKTKNKKGRERKKSDKITWSFFPSIPWKNLFVQQTLNMAIRGENLNCSSSKGT